MRRTSPRRTLAEAIAGVGFDTKIEGISSVWGLRDTSERMGTRAPATDPHATGL
jgi:hypothetical protein